MTAPIYNGIATNRPREFPALRVKNAGIRGHEDFSMVSSPARLLAGDRKKPSVSRRQARLNNIYVVDIL